MTDTARPQDRPERRGDLPWAQGTGRDLVEQRLEEVEVPPIDEGEVDPLVAAELPCGVQPPEAAADDDDAVQTAPVPRHDPSLGRHVGVR